MPEEAAPSVHEVTFTNEPKHILEHFIALQSLGVPCMISSVEMDGNNATATFTFDEKRLSVVEAYKAAYENRIEEIGLQKPLDKDPVDIEQVEEAVELIPDTGAVADAPVASDTNEAAMDTGAVDAATDATHDLANGPELVQERDAETVAKEIVAAADEAEKLAARKDTLTVQERSRLSELVSNILALLSELIGLLAEKIDLAAAKTLERQKAIFEMFKDTGAEYADAFRSLKDDVVGIVSKITSPAASEDVSEDSPFIIIGPKADGPAVDADDDPPIHAVEHVRAVVSPQADTPRPAQGEPEGRQGLQENVVEMWEDPNRKSWREFDWKLHRIKNGEGLNVLVDDPDKYVRAEVAWKGYGLDKLANDAESVVRIQVVRFLKLKSNDMTLEEWIAANPDKCALPENRAMAQVPTISGAKAAQKNRPKVEQTVSGPKQ